jgi:HK97 family phage prohead protease
MQEEIKNIDFQVDEESEGKVSAVFSVFNNLDSDGDVVVPGAIKSKWDSGMVPMVWAHKWDMPIGKGYIKEDGDKATFVGEFFMDTDSGQEAYKLVKNMGELQQWSFGYRVNDAEHGKFKERGNDDQVEARYLKSLTVFEVSPVLVGANQETYTMAIKSNNDLVEAFVKDSTREVDDEKAAMDKDVFDNPGEAMERSKKLSCAIGVHKHTVDGKDAFMPCKTHEEYEEAISKGDKGHTPQHSVMQALGTIAEDMKDILKNLPKDENADLPDWWVSKVKELAKDVNEIRDHLLDPKPEKALQNIYEDPAKALAEAETSGKTINIVEVDGKSYYKVDESVEEEGTEKLSFSRQVKDVLAAFNDLMARATAIAMLRAKDGRKLGMKATDALRAVQEDLTDAWSEVDEFITEFGAADSVAVEEVAEIEVEESTEEEATEEVEVAEAEAAVETVEEVEVIETEVVTEEEETEEEVEAEPAETPVMETEEVVAEDTVDQESDELWAEGQALIAESLEADLIEE